MNKRSNFEQRRNEELLWDDFQAEKERLRDFGLEAAQTLSEVAASVCSRYPLTAKTLCRAAYHPYVGLTSTLRVRKDVTYIRISDILKQAPKPVLESLIRLLIAQAGGRRPHREDVEVYQRYIRCPEIEALHCRTRMTRGRKTLIGPIGRAYDLDDSFLRVNRRYFFQRLERPTLSWSPTPSRRRLGYHDEARNLIVISRWLDRKAVPRYVIDYIMYHEMLHIAIPPVRRGNRRTVHSKAFLERERLFEEYDLASQWLERCATR